MTRHLPLRDGQAVVKALDVEAVEIAGLDYCLTRYDRPPRVGTPHTHQISGEFVRDDWPSLRSPHTPDLFLEADIGHAIDVLVTALDGTIDELGAHDSIVEYLPE